MRARLQLAFLTGRSDPRCCALGPSQRSFLAAVAAPGAVKVALNFPYDPSSAPHRPVPLWRASLANGWQYFVSRRPAFAQRYAPAVQALIDGAERTVLFAGSCGLELFANLEPALPAPTLARVELLAYGPVARRRPSCRSVLVQGRSDGISRAFFAAREVDVRIPGGHLDYLGRPELLAVAQQLVERILRETA